MQYTVDINGPIEAVCSAFAKGPRNWFPSQYGRGAGFDTKVTVEVGEPSSGGGWIEVPITWRAAHIKRVFPVMIGTLDFAPVDDRVTRLSVCGDYEPPLAKHLDGALMHKVAEAAVKELAESLAERLEALLENC